MEKTRTVFVLVDALENVKIFSNLKILCETMQDITEGFPSYWTLIRENFEGNRFCDIKTKQGEIFKIIGSNIIYPKKQDKVGSKLLQNKKDGQH